MSPTLTRFVLTALAWTTSATLAGSQNVGAVSGTVRFTGASVPGPTRISNTTDPQVCGQEHTLEDIVLEPGGSGVRYAIVAVEGIPKDRLQPPPPGVVLIDNTSCRFAPHAAVATIGSTLEALNSDPVLHTTHLYGPRETNISLPVQGTRVSRRLDRPGLYVIKCDVHGWMQAFVRVDAHPFHAVTGDNGGFTIDGIPPGQYVLSVWHEKLGRREVPIRVEAGATERLDIDYAAPEP